jgi:predicted ATPase
LTSSRTAGFITVTGAGGIGKTRIALPVGEALAVVEAIIEDTKALGVLPLLSSLVDKSLIVADVASQEARFRLLESSRQYTRIDSSARMIRATAAILKTRPSNPGGKTLAQPP